MANLKWAEVAHMYINSGITSKDGHDFVECRDGQTLWQYHDEAVQDFPFELPDGDFPILRHRNDMTEAEALRIFKIVHGDDGGEYSAPNALIWFKRCIDDRGMSPNFMYGCISLGFDVFGLIESGEAIRKEKTA